MQSHVMQIIMQWQITIMPNGACEASLHLFHSSSSKPTPVLSCLLIQHKPVGVLSSNNDPTQKLLAKEGGVLIFEGRLIFERLQYTVSILATPGHVT